MFKKTITYEDYNGEMRTEDYWFHLNEAEIIQWLMTEGDYSLDQVLIRLMEKRNGKEVMKIFDDFIRLSYGEKSLDGKHFVKNKEIWENFRNTEAYSSLFMELVTDANKAVEFINHVIPKSLADSVTKAMAEDKGGLPDTLQKYAGPIPVLPS